MQTTPTFAGVKAVILETLGIQDRATRLEPSTPLLGGIPELDSMAVLELASALEERFGLTIDDSDFTGEVFETIGSLSAFVDQKLADAGRGETP